MLALGMSLRPIVGGPFSPRTPAFTKVSRSGHMSGKDGGVMGNQQAEELSKTWIDTDHSQLGSLQVFHAPLQTAQEPADEGAMLPLICR